MSVEIYASIIENADGTRDVEFLDSEPTDSFRAGLLEGLNAGRIKSAEIRVGSVNGGDSATIFRASA